MKFVLCLQCRHDGYILCASLLSKSAKNNTNQLHYFLFMRTFINKQNRLLTFLSYTFQTVFMAYEFALMSIFFTTFTIALAIGLTLLACLSITIFAIQTSVRDTKKVMYTYKQLCPFLVGYNRLWCIPLCWIGGCIRFRTCG